MLCPKVEVLGQAVGRCRVGELIGLTKGRRVGLIDPRAWITRNLWMIRVHEILTHWCFKGLVMLWEWALCHCGRKEPANTLRVHDEWPCTG